MLRNTPFSRSNSAGETKYLEQYSINTNIPGHSLRVFSVQITPKNPIKNCERLKITKSVFWGMSNYQYKNGNVFGYGITKTEFNPEKKYISGTSTIYYNIN